MPHDKGRPEAALETSGEDITTVTDDLTMAEANRLVTRIELRLDTIAENIEQVLPLIEQAKVGNAHTVLGYRSWTEFVSEKFGGRLARLGRADRVPLVHLLADQGMSTRAIAPIVGATKSQVARDIAAVPNGTPAEFAMADASDEEFEAALSSARADGDLSQENVVSKITEKKITGIDGKTYTKPEPKKPPRRPITDQARDAGWDLDKVLRRIGRIGEDDRFEANKAQVCKNLWTHLRGSVVLADKVFEHLAEVGYFDDDSAFRLLMMSATNDLRRALDRLARLDDLDPGGHAGDLDHIRAQADKQLARADAIAEGWLH